MTRTVWIVECGVYEQRYIAGVYDSIEAVIADNPEPTSYRFPKEPSAMDLSRPGGWRPCDPKKPEGAWSNGMDHGYAASAEPYEVQS